MRRYTFVLSFTRGNLAGLMFPESLTVSDPVAHVERVNANWARGACAYKIAGWTWA